MASFEVQYFLGANSPTGFYSLYDQMIDRAKARRLYILKGGPGCGKSTLMRRVAERAKAAGQEVEYILCSGDPDSLDAVILPGMELAVADGTAPHVIEPDYPGVVEQYVNLGDCYRPGLEEVRQGILAATKDYKAGYRSSYRCLGAAGKVLEELRGTLADPEQREVDIRLDPLLTPQQNAAKYYKEYNKAKTAEKMLTIQLAKGRTELEYLNSVLENISLSEGERDLKEIRQELASCGYLRGAKVKGQEKRANSKPMEFRSSAGLRISVGKNNTQNDLLTCKQAFKSDIWFHTQKIHGSHVILWTEGKAPDAQSLNEAASLAAWFSQGRDGGKVPVDYTPVKFVKKPAGARPGMVVYTTYETAWVTPDGELAKRLRVK